MSKDSFFLAHPPSSKKGKKQLGPKRKLNKIKLAPTSSKKKASIGKGRGKDSEIEFEEDDEEEPSTPVSTKKNKGDISSDDDEQDSETNVTLAEKKVKMAKEYLKKLNAHVEASQEEREKFDNTDHNMTKQDKMMMMLANASMQEVAVMDVFLRAGFSHTTDIFTGHSLSVSCAVLSSDEKYLYTASKDGSIIKYDVATKKRLHRAYGLKKSDVKGTPVKTWPLGHYGPIQSLALSSDGNLLASSGRQHNILVWNTSSLDIKGQLSGHKGDVTCLAFNKRMANGRINMNLGANDTLYSGSTDRTLRIWNVDYMSFSETLYGHMDAVMYVDTIKNTNSNRIISAGGRDNSVRVWKIVEESQILLNHKIQNRKIINNVEIAKMLSTDLYISGTEDGSLLLWRVSSKHPLCIVPNAHPHTNRPTTQNTALSNDLFSNQADYTSITWITAIAVIPFSDTVVTGSCNGEIKFWRLVDGKSLVHVKSLPMPGFVNSLEFSASGSKLVVAIGNESKLGRWAKIPNVKSCTKVLNFSL